jgi:hypothetical protein
VGGGWRRLHSEELHDLNASPKAVKSREMRWKGQAVRAQPVLGIAKDFVSDILLIGQVSDTPEGFMAVK